MLSIDANATPVEVACSNLSALQQPLAHLTDTRKRGLQEYRVIELARFPGTILPPVQFLRIQIFNPRNIVSFQSCFRDRMEYRNDIGPVNTPIIHVEVGVGSVETSASAEKGNRISEEHVDHFRFHTPSTASEARSA